MDFSEIAVYTTSESSEVVAYFLSEVCMDGVSIYDINDLYANSGWDYKEEGIELRYDSEVAVKGYCKTEDTQRVLDFLRSELAHLSNAGSLRIEVRTVDGDAWVAKWKETFRPIETNRLVICPEWQSVATDKAVLLLDSGVAFGTGQHETTAMCIELLEGLSLGGKSVLDVGCGSGILGLGALLLGAKHAVLADIDPQATDIARHNAKINKLTSRATIITGDLTADVSGTFDIVLANLTADILARLHNGLASVVHSGTLLILSGILDVKLKEVLALYADYDLLQTHEMGEWRSLLLKAR